jgi:hypothetical protein
MNAPVEGPNGVSECEVETSEAPTAGRRDGTAIAAEAAGADE